MLAVVIFLMGVVFRLLPHFPNFTPISAMALFGGAKLGKKYGLLIPFLAMVFSDYLLTFINPGYPMFHSTTLYVWGSFLISGLIGLWLRKNGSRRFILGGTLLASLQFFIITNFGVWASGYYPPDFNGLMQSYIEAIPFFRNTLMGDLFYTTVFFGGYSLIVRLKTISLKEPS